MSEQGPRASCLAPLSAQGMHSFSSLLWSQKKKILQGVERGHYKVSCSVQAVTGASTTIQFFLSEAFLGQHFEAVELEQGDPEPGDLFLFRLRSLTGRWCGAHVGVYCGHGEIIHFEGKKPGSCGPHRFLGSWEGVVCKQGQGPMLRSRSLWRVLRRRGGINRTLLELRVREAMDTDPPPYHPTRNNCVHFALHLLGLDRNPNSASLDLELTMGEA